MAARNVGIGRFGTAPNAPHLTGYINIHKDAEFTTTQTGTVIWTPNPGKKFVVSDITINIGGATDGIITIWQGASGDTTYNAGTDPAVFRGEFASGGTIKQQFVKNFRIPYVSTTPDHLLRITTSANITCYIQIEGYEI